MFWLLSWILTHAARTWLPAVTLPSSWTAFIYNNRENSQIKLSFSHKVIVVQKDFNQWPVEVYIILLTSRWHEGTKSVMPAMSPWTPWYSQLRTCFMFSGPCVVSWIHLCALGLESWVIYVTKASDISLFFIKLPTSDHQSKNVYYTLYCA